jgi:hypothetical protein
MCGSTEDGYPYPVDRDTYDSSIVILENAVRHMRAERSEKEGALRRLASWTASVS